jgi:hypothetical protein
MHKVSIVALHCIFLGTLLTPALAHKQVVVVPLGADADPVTIRVAEDAGIVTIPINRSEGSEGNVTVMFRTLNGSATNSEDYSGIPTPIPVTWPDGNTNQRTISLPIFPDNLLEKDETFKVQITSTDPDLTDSRSEAIVVIEDVPPGKIQFEIDNYTVSESAGTITLTLMRFGGDEGEINVSIRTFDGTATNGLDYFGIQAPISITWPDGNSNVRTTPLPLVNHSISEGIENFTIEISSANSDWLSTQKVANVSIRESNIFLLNQGKIRIIPPTERVLETAASITLELERFGGSFGTISAELTTIDGTAINGQDYTGIVSPIPITWSDGDTATKTLTLPIHKDSRLEAKETFTVNLAGSYVGFPSQAIVTIKDVPPGKIHFGE